MHTLYQLTEVRRYLTGWMQRQGGDSFRLLWFPKMGHGEMNFGPVGPETHNLQSKCIALLPCKILQNAQTAQWSGHTLTHSPRGWLRASELWPR